MGGCASKYESKIIHKHPHKLVLLGEPQAGKTSLIETLKHDSPQLQDVDERTIALDISEWLPERQDVKFKIFDFGGHKAYHILYPLFLSKQAIYLLCFDIEKYTPEKYDRFIGNWIKIIQYQVPDAVVALVGTHADDGLNDRVEEVRTDIQNKVENQLNSCYRSLKASKNKVKEDIDVFSKGKEKNQLEQRQQKLKQLEMLAKNKILFVNPDKSPTGAMQLKPYVFAVSSSAKYNINNLKDNIISFSQSTTIFPEIELSKNEQSFLKNIDSCSKNVLTWEKICSLHKKTKSVKHIETTLTKFHDTGELLWYQGLKNSDSYVIKELSLVEKVLKSIFSHNLKQEVTTENRKLCSVVSQQGVLLNMEHLKMGYMSSSLFNYLLGDDFQDEEEIRTVTDFLQRYNLAYRVTRGSKIFIHIPWLLADKQEPQMPDQAPTGDGLKLILKYEFVNQSTELLYAQLVPCVMKFLSYQSVWRTGLNAVYNIQVLRKHLEVLIKYKDGDEVCPESSNISIYVNAPFETAAQQNTHRILEHEWLVLHYVHHEIQELLKKWKGMYHECWLLCQHCIKEGDANPGHYPADHLLLQSNLPKTNEMEICPKTGTYIPGERPCTMRIQGKYTH